MIIYGGRLMKLISKEQERNLILSTKSTKNAKSRNFPAKQPKNHHDPHLKMNKHPSRSST